MKKYYSHFIQKALINNFISDGEIKYFEYANDEMTSQNPKSKNSKHKSAEKCFYSAEIEKLVTQLEKSFIFVVNKIINNQYKKIQILEKELITLKFYTLLHSVRTRDMRELIKNKKLQSMEKGQFEKMVNFMNKNPKEFQEMMMENILKEYKNILNKKENILNDLISTINKSIKNQKETIEYYTQFEIFFILISHPTIIKFNENKLFLGEHLISEKSIERKNTFLKFMPLSSEYGVVFYYGKTISFDGEKTHKWIDLPKSKIFDNYISEQNYDVSHIRKNEIAKNQQFVIKGNAKIDKIKGKIHGNLKNNNTTGLWTAWYNEIAIFFYKDLDDKYNFDILSGSNDVLKKINAMTLLANSNGLIIYQNKKDIYEAKKMITLKDF